MTWLYRPLLPSGQLLAGGAGGNIDLAANSGSFIITGQAASLVAARTISAESGSFAITGSDAALSVSIDLSAESGSFAITGQDAGLLVARTLSAEVGAVSINGQAALLLQGFVVSAEAGSFSVSGQDADLLQGYVLNADGAAYVIAGQDAELTATGDKALNADAGSIVIAGSDAELIYTPIVIARTSGGGFGPTDEEYRAHLRQLKARQRKLEEQRRKNAEALRLLIRRAAGLDVPSDAVVEAVAEIKVKQPRIAADIETAPSAASLAVAERKLYDIGQRIKSIEAAIANLESERAEDDDIETLILLAA